MQGKLERKLDIDLSAGASAEESEWQSDSSTGEYTLGDVVERKDS
jgi:putative transcription factor